MTESYQVDRFGKPLVGPASDPIDEAIPDGSPFERAHFQRNDETSDELFYTAPRLVTHVDDAAIAALRDHYAKVFPPQASLLDLMSSWICHYPNDLQAARVAGLGMNAEELAANPQLSEWTVQNLNKEPTLPYEAESFDAVTIAVSVQYLQRPVAVFREIARVLKPGGACIVSFSNRCFPTKAIQLWLAGDDATHVQIVGAYFHYSRLFDPPEALDLSPKPGASDPLHVVQAHRAEAERAPDPGD
jgi:SAM-dependent methyltransferase